MPLPPTTNKQAPFFRPKTTREDIAGAMTAWRPPIRPQTAMDVRNAWASSQMTEDAIRYTIATFNFEGYGMIRSEWVDDLYEKTREQLLDTLISLVNELIFQGEEVPESLLPQQPGGSKRRRPKRTKRRPSISRSKLSRSKLSKKKKSKKKRKKTRRRRR